MATNAFRGDDFTFVATNLQWVDSFSGQRLFIKLRSIFKETNPTVKNLGRRLPAAVGEFKGQLTRSMRGVVGVMATSHLLAHARRVSSTAVSTTTHSLRCYSPPPPPTPHNPPGSPSPRQSCLPRTPFAENCEGTMCLRVQ